MKKETLEDKKKELEQLKREVEEEEYRISIEKEMADAKEQGLYTPLATATIKHDLYSKDENDFRGIGYRNVYSVRELLGKPDFKKGTKVVLLNLGECEEWFPFKKDGDYFGIDNDNIGIPDDEVNRKHLTRILYVK